MKKAELLFKFARWLSRSETEIETIRSPKMVLFQLLLLALVALGPAYLFYDGVIANRARWESDRFAVPLADSDWRAGINLPNEQCPAGAAPGTACPVHPENPGLWSSALRRSDPGVPHAFAGPGAKVLWLGTVLAPETRARIREESALVLLLGYFSVPPRIWIDDTEVSGGDPSSLIPLMLTIREERFADSRPLRIAIRMEVEEGARRPDTLYRNGAGFITGRAAGHVISRVQFEAETRPIILMSVNALLTLIFAVLWISFPKNQEYWYLALFTLLQTFAEVILIHTVYLKFSARTVYALDVINESYLGGFGMLLGLAYARTSLRILKYAFPFVVALPLVFVPFIEGSAGFYQLSLILGSYVVPLYFTIGAGTCALQAAHLYSKRHESAYHSFRKRVGRLTAFTVILLTMMALYLAASNELASAQYVYYQRYIHMGLVLLVGLLFILDYRSQELLLEKSFVSKWHRQAQGAAGALPGKVRGALLKFDMKNSTTLSREFGSYGHLTDQWYRLMTEVLWRHKGEILFEEGDLIAAFFDGGPEGSAVLAALQTVRELDEEQRQLQQTLGMKSPIAFRGCIIEGELGLSWKMTGPMRKAGYTGNILVDSSRVLDLEKKIFGKDGRTLVVMEEAAAREVLRLHPELDGKFVLRGKAVADSDGRERVIWAYDADPAVNSPTPPRT